MEQEPNLKIRLHKVEDQLHVANRIDNITYLKLQNVEKEENTHSDDVLVLDLLKELDLAKRCSIHAVLGLGSGTQLDLSQVYKEANS